MTKNPLSFLSKRLNKETILFIFSFFSLVSVYLIWKYFYTRQETLIHQIYSTHKELEVRALNLELLKKTAEDLRSVLHQDEQKKTTRQSKGELLKRLARQHQFFHLHFTFMPEKSVYQDRAFIMKKSLVRLQFSTGDDRNVWEFLKDLYQYFPGIILSKDFKLKTEEFSDIEQHTLTKNFLLKGTYSFEWYTLSSLSSKKIP